MQDTLEKPQTLSADIEQKKLAIEMLKTILNTDKTIHITDTGVPKSKDVIALYHDCLEAVKTR